MRTMLRFNIRQFFSLAQILYSVPQFVLQFFICDVAVTFKLSESPCGNTNLTGSKGTIASPNYPSAYPGNVKCEWRIHSPAESVLRINIIDLDIVQDEPCHKTPCCSQQGLLVPIEGGRGLKLLCGNVSVDKTIIVSQPMTVIQYFSGVNGKTGRGFEITYNIDVRTCKSHELECINGKCVANDSFCNGIDDCGDSSDEMYCPHVKHEYDFYPKKMPNAENHLPPKVCLDGWQVCPLSPGHCYSPQSDICDGEFDCPKGEDEIGCVPSCPDQIACSSGDGCYYPGQRCNMIRNCRDNSDETGCPAEPCIAMQFTCLNRACVSGTAICDGNNDCGDFSDEENCSKPSFLTAAIMGLLSCLFLFCIGLSCLYRIYSVRLRSTGGFVHHLEPEPMDEEFMYREPPPAYSVAIGESQTPTYLDSELMERYYESDTPPRILPPRLLPPRIPPPRILAPNRRRHRTDSITGRSRPRPASLSTQMAMADEQQPKIGRLTKNDPNRAGVIELLGFPDETPPIHNYFQRNNMNESPCSSPSLSSSRESVTSSTSLEDHEDLVRPC